MCAVTMQQRHMCPRPRKGGTASTLSPSHLVLQSTAAEFHISHQSAAAVVWTVREVHAHLAAQFGGASVFGVPCLRTHHARLGEALNVWPHWATPIKIGSGGAGAFRIASPKTHHNRLEEALNVWPYWATPIKIGGGAADPFRVVCSKSQRHRLGEVLNDWCTGAALTLVKGHIWPIHQNWWRRHGHIPHRVLERTQQKSRVGPKIPESKIQEQCLDGIVEWDHGDIVNWVTTGQWRGEMGVWDLHERVVTNAKRKCTEKESQ
ncbi:hypothetical protein B0H10DRAFT_2194342 [Mycena sp. CBHHK59/15]|nr:hypothetical protein B0H10DRAFT_2194342 [Mycena sp. CBHHK59/15]